MGKACASAEVLQVVGHNKRPTTKVTGRNKVFWLHDRHQPRHSTVAQLLAVEETKIAQVPSAALLGIAASLLMNGVVDSEGTAKTGPRFRGCEVLCSTLMNRGPLVPNCWVRYLY